MSDLSHGIVRATELEAEVACVVEEDIWATHRITLNRENLKDYMDEDQTFDI